MRLTRRWERFQESLLGIALQSLDPRALSFPPVYMRINTLCTSSPSTARRKQGSGSFFSSSGSCCTPLSPASYPLHPTAGASIRAPPLPAAPLEPNLETASNHLSPVLTHSQSTSTPSPTKESVDDVNPAFSLQSNQEHCHAYLSTSSVCLLDSSLLPSLTHPNRAVATAPIAPSKIRYHKTILSSLLSISLFYPLSLPDRTIQVSGKLSAFACTMRFRA